MNRPVHRAGPVQVRCISCGWYTERKTWRPARRSLAAHVAKRHPGIAA